MVHALAGTVAANSFLASEGNVLYAGKFNPDGLGTMRRYAVNLTTGELGAAGAAIQVPKKTQGLTVLPNYFIFSTFEGRDNRSNVYVVKRGYSALQTSYDNGNLRCVRLPSMSEGVTLSNNRQYRPPDARDGSAGVGAVEDGAARQCRTGSPSTSVIRGVRYRCVMTRSGVPVLA